MPWLCLGLSDGLGKDLTLISSPRIAHSIVWHGSSKCHGFESSQAIPKYIKVQEQPPQAPDVSKKSDLAYQKSTLVDGRHHLPFTENI
jgi:hypothetical protein